MFPVRLTDWSWTVTGGLLFFDALQAYETHHNNNRRSRDVGGMWDDNRDVDSQGRL